MIHKWNTIADTDSSATHASSRLISAAERGQREKVKQLLVTNQVPPNSKKRYESRTALHAACGYGQESAVHELLAVRPTFWNTLKGIKGFKWK